MHYLALATDYDGTLARQGKVDEPTLAAIDRLRESGRRLILVTGRELDDLIQVFPEIDRFDRVVAENGAVLYRPKDRSEAILAERPPDSFVADLTRRGSSRSRSVWWSSPPGSRTRLRLSRRFATPISSFR